MGREGSQSVRRFGTFDGVFTPTLLTILGVIMFLREGWVVGELGVFGAIAVILAASTITTCTALSVSSIATNVQLGAGGPYAIVTRSLGVEVGGSIGIPLFLSQALAVAMYIFGLREGWCWLFPEHPSWVVDAAAFVVVVGLTLVSTSLAFKVQYLVLAIIGAALVSVATGLVRPTTPHEIEWLRWSGGGFWEQSRFWIVFAVFFPATTGILAGANMSGELKKPGRNIPLGTLTATGIATVVYIALAFWLGVIASGDELRDNFTVMIDHAGFPPLVLAGLLAATFSSALSAFVGAPRILHALAAGRVVPFGKWLAGGRSEREPRRAAVATAAVVLLGLALRDLNVIAPLITLFFLITYGMINAVVLLEQRLAVVSFRPRLRLPSAVPFAGAIGALGAMFVVNATFSLLALAVVVGVYTVLMRRHLAAPADDVRSGLFLMIAEWAARRAGRFSERRARAWKANLLVPVLDIAEVRRHIPLIVDLTGRYGSITLLGVSRPGAPVDFHERLEELADELLEAGVHTTAGQVRVEQVHRGVIHAMQTLRDAFLRPNVVFLTPGTEAALEGEIESIIRAAKDNRMGVVLAAQHPELGLAERRTIDVWVRPQGPEWTLEQGTRLSNLNLQVLVAYLMWQAWDGKLTLRCAVSDEEEVEKARAYLAQIVELTRIPSDSEIVVEVADLPGAMAAAPQCDLHVLGLPPEGEIAFARGMRERGDATCLLVHDSGEEDALA
jgi:amino acid transporter